MSLSEKNDTPNDDYSPNNYMDSPMELFWRPFFGGVTLGVEGWGGVDGCGEKAIDALRFSAHRH